MTGRTRDMTTGEAEAYRQGWLACWQGLLSWVTCNSSPDGGAALERMIGPAPQPSGWQPIETAPRDGREVLTFSPDEVWEVGFWHLGSEQWCSPGGGTLPFEPTHWMPLPTPPENARARPAEPVSGGSDAAPHRAQPCTALSGEKTGQCACLWEYLNAWRKEPAE